MQPQIPDPGSQIPSVSSQIPSSTSGTAVAVLFHRLLAAVYLLAWLSLLWQVDTLIGSRGLLPIDELARLPADQRLSRFASFPTLFLWTQEDWVLGAGIWLGIALALAWLAGLVPRFLAFASALLYLSYATAARDFLHFQWDNMIIECGMLAALLPRDRPARWLHFLFRVLLFKLYFESGIAKWQSYLGDWHDGSAMVFYYETAPIPTWLAWYAHHLPASWHLLESRLVLVVELLVPFAIFAGRVPKLICFAVLTSFQLINVATANYGFFCYLSLALHVFLLADRDVAWLASPKTADISRPPRPVAVLRVIGAALVVSLYLTISSVEAAFAFARPPANEAIDWVRRIYLPWRAINTYHLFGHITRERIEPDFQTFDGTSWESHDLQYKPGDPDRRPPFVAPHQPRVDFRLWFYGLSYRRGTPGYVQTLVRRLCNDPEAVQSLFSEPLPRHAEAVRIAFWRYRFSDSGPGWWSRTPEGQTNPIECSRLGSGS